ncbi:sushi, von Willebrand factor type A, EGF and pentraxin domain-containing protein 1 [Aplysia californica]|uniref:Sushi, von Willebrand factor type A, EGF and pentraxin domain-containing protein 1 n=1 Tax=Aplysia californica TaxID=6500 RepID=A0ABM1A016_APLCA|nr:sushi, von Willebrand factor type A, EGF and pentraxin domain-containing protein 1 [Aplysia californica]
MGSLPVLTLTVIGCLLVQSSEARTLFRRPSSYNTFMRSLTLNFEKAKVETLGAIFKRHVQHLRNTPNRQVELVFLIDSSGTVGEYYFYEEVRFVRNLLADFTVDVNTTRVSVITFSSPHKIFRHIDYLSRPDSENHKCRLLNEDITEVDYTPGGTNTLGALLEAEKVLRSARKNAAKAIFLMTDGYSNGGDPRPVAHKLKRQGVKIFTFGIRDGFVWELQDMASEPKNETCYILDSFEEFEALAKKALHADLQSGSYIKQPASKCSRLCSKGGPCCHQNASCSCGTYTGKYECLCMPGYYGTGRGVSGCKPCPSGTYKNFSGQGDLHVCQPCPYEHQSTTPGAVSPNECSCKRGYRTFGSDECTVFRCPELSPPKHGYFVNNKCNNVFNAACGLRCQHGYELRGSSVRICQDDGSWSGQDAECIMKTCPSLPPPKSGHMVCSTDDFSYSTVCRFTCNAGYQLLGSRKRTCLAIAYWTGIATRCREITCPPLVQIKDGTIAPSSCTAREVVFGSTCSISCSSGYSLRGPHTKQCTPDGTWMAVEDGVNKCVDDTPPVLHCPESMEVIADHEKETTEVAWTAPVPVDNSGFRPVLTSEPAVTPGSRFPIGTTYITYKAEDLSENVAECQFYIRVVDKTPPRVDTCVSPPSIVSEVEAVEVNLDPPEFSDNSGKPVEIASSHRNGELFSMGTTKVTYKAFDGANNNSTCVIDVTIIPHLCMTPEHPINGNVSCEEGPKGVTCRISCRKGYAFAIPPADEYFCSYEDGSWLPQEHFPFPDCAVIQISNDILQPASITLTGDLSCQDRVLLHRIERNLEGTVQDKLSNACDKDLSCSVGSMNSVCENEEDFNKIQVVLEDKRPTKPRRRRRKRQVREYPEKARLRRVTESHRSRISFDFTLQGAMKKNMSRRVNMSEPMRKMITSLQREARKGNLDLRVGGRTLKFAQMKYNLGQHTYRCPEGSVLVNGTCVNCPVGTFYHVVNRRCEDCPQGTYQPLEGHNTCLRCPDNMSTERPHTRSLHECKELCLPGTSSANGLSPCETCPLGLFQSDYSARFCHHCPDGTTTHRRGTRTVKACAELCPPGQASETGLSPCLPCPSYSYQPSRGQTQCIRCPAEGIALQNGATKVEDCIIPPGSWEMQSDKAISPDGSDGSAIFFNSCFADPCENGGTCSPGSGQSLFTCSCPKGFKGNTCDEYVNMCEGNPCGDKGICEPVPGNFLCFCNEGFTGKNCEVNIDDCEKKPCTNQGTCVDGIDSFTCNCPPGYTGDVCEKPINDCQDFPCRNDGTCINSLSGFTCECLPGYTGQTCEVDMDECLLEPCQNGGTCVDLPGTYSCNCVRGYTGDRCESEVNECAEIPCQNGATCEDLKGDFKCMCALGFTGKKCEKELTSQYQLDFSSPTVMDYAELTIDKPLTSVTVSFWMKTTDEVNQGTPFSYAVFGEPNALTITDYKNLNLIINGETMSIGQPLNDGQWHHVVLTWSSYRGDWKAYVDGLLRDQGYNLSTSKPIPGKGTLIVGQEQDELGGGFSPSETFVGSLTHLNVWDDALSLADIEKLRFSCDSFYGNVISWPQVQEALKGNVGTSPSQFCQDCPDPKKPTFGSVQYSSVSPGATAEYECNTGYSLAGNPKLTCLISAVWDESPPGCYPISCGHPGSIRNGYIEGRDFSYDKRIRFRCNAGYELVGHDSLYCTEYGDWDVDKPECIEIKCDLPEVSGNTVPSSTEKKFQPGDTVDFSCRPGSTLQTDHNSIVCQRDGSWDKSIPSCDLERCSYPPAIGFGEPFTANPEYFVGESVKYQCDYGYEFSKEAGSKTSVTCLPSGQWDTDMPVCGLIECPDPPSVPNADYEGDEITFNARVTYTCNPGFQPVGFGEIKCEETRSWSALSFACRPVICGPPPSPDYGTVTGRLYRFNSVVSYQCDLGYSLKGKETRRCSEDGAWSGDDPVCEPVSCGGLEDIRNGQVFYVDSTYLSQAKYSCDKGFELNGFAERTCEATGQWDPEQPTCEPRSCPAPEDIARGSYSSPDGGVFVYQSKIEYRCTTGLQLVGNPVSVCQADGTWSSAPYCDEVTCPALDTPDNGSVDVLGERFSDWAQYECDPGYKLEGVNRRTCQADGTWSDEAPECVPTKCPDPKPLENGYNDYKDLSVDSTVRSYCDKGFKMVGDSFRTCQADFTLTGVEPKCVPVDCGTPADLENGGYSLSGKGTLFEADVTYNCDDGYTIRGAATRTCLSDGQWSGKTPSCLPVECTKVSRIISNGRANGTSITYGSIIFYECDKGYLLEGSALRKCQADGKWDEPIPSCLSVECPRPRLSNGFVSSFRRGYGTVIKFSCKYSYRLEGPSERTCLENGQWSGEEPRCLKLSCPPPEKVVNSETTVINDTAIEITCNPGYTLIGSSIRVCNRAEIWRPDAPICSTVTCPDLSGITVTNGQIEYTTNNFGDVVKYTCDEGYKMKGSALQTCLPIGEWGGVIPTCNPVSCGHPGILFNGYSDGWDFSYSSVVEFSCDLGFMLKGPSEIRCLADGTWDAELPECQEVVCPELTDTIKDGTVDVLGNSFNSETEYFCNEGFRLIGDDIRFCQEDGQWTGTEPTCSKVVCPEPETVVNAQISGSDFDVGGKIYYDCIEGYTLVGSFERTCEYDGTWSSKAPACYPVTCPEPPFMDYGIYNGESGQFQAIITYSCDEGYELVGPRERMCQANATWSGEDPRCVRISCGSPPSIDFAVINQNTNFLYQDKVIYSCLEGYSASGYDTSECLANRTWSYTDFRCTVISCPVILASDIPHAIFDASGFTYNSRVGFSCEEGYTLYGESELVCTAQGRWSAEYPFCRIVQCPKLGELAFGTINLDSNDFGSIATFTCDQGYELNGAENLECLSSGAWSNALPLCQLIKCLTVPSVENGRLTNPQIDFFYSDKAVYECDFGYRMTGSGTLGCLASGEFESPAPECVRILCKTPVEIDFGVYDMLSDLQVAYTCNEGFILNGQSVIDCELGGKWAAVAPTCIPVECPVPGAFINGRIVGDVFSFGNYIMYECDPGYILKGYPVRVCQANRTWTEVEPKCEPVSCGKPTEPFENGVILGDSYLFGDGIEYSCFPGFELKGEVLRLCGSDARWGGKVPSCSRLRCEDPEPIKYGKIKGRSYLFGDSVTYSCVRGYELVGEALRTCEETLTWSGAIPSCVRISCGEPPVPDNGIHLGKSYLFDDIVNISCNYGFRLSGKDFRRCKANGAWTGGQISCETIVCPSVPEVANSNHNITADVSLTVDTTVAYRCLEGYDLKVDEDYRLNDVGLRVCELTGQWSTNLIECVPVNCPEILSIEYGSVTGKSFIYQSVVDFSCDKGFELVGLSSLECGAKGLWSADIPFCSVVGCPELFPEHGTSVMFPDDFSTIDADRNDHFFIYGDIITFECDDGYELQGELKSECMASGIWSNSKSYCTPVSCPEPVIANALLSKSLLTYGSTVSVSCVTGYDLIGENELTCGADKAWVETLPRCELLACGSPPSVLNAIVVGDNFNLGGTITYQCKAGYDLVGNNILTCGLTNEWLGTLPICVEVDCKLPPVFPFSQATVGKTTYKSTVNVLCNLGYIRQGNGTLVCGSDRNWKYDQALRCVPIDCGEPPEIKHGSFFADNSTLGAVAVYSCEMGYFNNGASSLFCDESGQWVYEYPTCLPVDCLQPPSIPHADSTYEESIFKSTAIYICDEGYVLQNADINSLICGDMGTWEGERPACSIIDCGSPPTSDHSYFIPDTESTYLSEITHFCEPGYSSALSVNKMTCQASGFWEGEMIRCEPLECTDLPPLANGEYQSDTSMTFGSSVSYSCSQGFVKSGPEALLCTETGQWSSQNHACLPIDCLDPQPLTNGKPEYSTTIYKSEVVYTCLEGYTLQGDTSSRCLDSGLWSSVNTQCIPVDCFDPPSLGNGNALYNSTIFGSKVRYQCNNGYQLFGDAQALCTSTGLWSEGSTRCELIQCSPPVDIANGQVIYSSQSHGSVAVYTCLPGYELEGFPSIICSNTGTWEGEIPVCIVTSCQAPPEIQHGSVVYLSLEAGSTASFLCDPGYFLNGPEYLECTNEGLWSGAYPTCAEIFCTDPPVIYNAVIISDTGRSPDDTLTYSCVQGYHLANDFGSDITLTCNIDGSWEGLGPQCVPVSCDIATLPNIPHARWEGTGNTYGTQVLYSCSDGYALVGDESLTCNELGIWSFDELPRCEPKPCGLPPSYPQATYKAPEELTFGQGFSYVCNPGHDVQGSAYTECGADGQWSPVSFVCQGEPGTTMCCSL